MGISKVTRNCQITLPKDIRQIIGVKEGDEVLFTIQDNGVRLVKAKKDIVAATAGIWKDTKETGIEFQRRIREEGEKRLRRLYGSSRY
ncbi:MAG TPA: AbrB/MazE/SpoVT family DNA-binding domain-containing protein [Candidatus Nanoarchaeia archaeon]|nr:AbrB/MazE/SpoVT family DNA-binding domain-containing protein [Candidatus Nanoarchaeia archaeon]